MCQGGNGSFYTLTWLVFGNDFLIIFIFAGTGHMDAAEMPWYMASALPISRLYIIPAVAALAFAIKVLLANRYTIANNLRITP